jgi:hypothetical protein
MASAARRSWFSRNREVASDAPTEPEVLPVKLPTLWKAMILTSFIINLVLIAVLIYLSGFLLQNRGYIGGTTQNIAGNVRELQDVVVQLQKAHIKTTIPLDQPLPVHLIVPIDTTTTVTTTAPVPINVPAFIDMGPFGQLRPNVSLELPAGTQLNIALKLAVPLDTTIPVKLDVPVDIPMEETALAPQFQRLGAVLNRLLSSVGPLIGVPIPETLPPIQEPPTPPPTPQPQP